MDRTLRAQTKSLAKSIAWSNPLAWWWGFISLVSAANIAVWFVLYREFHGTPADVGSAPASEMEDWIEYMTAPVASTLAQERAADGRTQPRTTPHRPVDCADRRARRGVIRGAGRTSRWLISRLWPADRDRLVLLWRCRTPAAGPTSAARRPP